MKKKLLSILIMICICINFAVYAETTPVISIDDVTAAIGEEVTLAIAVKDNPGFAAMMIELAYDSEKLTPVSVEGGSVTKEANIVSNIQQGGEDKEFNPVTFFVVNPADFTGDGDVFLVTFLVNEKAEAGKTELTLSYEEEAIANQKYEDIIFEIDNGSITIEAKSDDVVSNEDNTNTAEDKEDEAGEEQQETQTGEESEDTLKDEPKKDITITIDGNNVEFDQPPVIINDRTLVPMRAIFEALGADVTWEEDSRTAVGTKDDVTIRIQIDNTIMKKNDSDITLDVPAQLVNDRTLVPIRAISESFGCKVDWVDDTKTVVIVTE